MLRQDKSFPTHFRRNQMTRFDKIDKADVVVTSVGCLTGLVWIAGLLLSLVSTAGFAACVFFGAYYLCTGKFFFS